MSSPYHYQPIDPPTLDVLMGFGTATLHEAMGQRGAMTSAIRPIAPGLRLAGAALTVECATADNLMIHAALEHARAGDVLVVDAKGYLEAGLFGDVLATAAQARGVTGIVIDGCVRDTAALREMGFAAFARGISIRGTTKDAWFPLGRAINCGGLAVSPGDAVIGDDDGVVVVPRAEIGSAVAASHQRVNKEAQFRRRLRSGETTVDILGLRGRLRSVEERDRAEATTIGDREEP